MAFVPLDIQPTKKSKEDKEDKVGFFESALAGVATGLWNIPKGIVSLGAEIYDLAADANTAKEVEEWFDNVNPFDDEAEARTVGKITQALTQVGIPAYQGFKIGSSLASRALAARKTGKYMKLGTIGSKIMSPTAGGIVGGGIGEALVADEDIGTFADLVRGTSLEPYAITMLDLEDKEGRADAFRKLKNRLKFGTEGALFNLALVGAGRGIQKLRGVDVEPLDQFAKTSIEQDAQRYGLKYGFRPEGFLEKSTFEIKEYFKKLKDSTNFAASSSVKDLDNAMKNVEDEVIDKFLEPKFKLKTTEKKKELFKDKIQQFINPTDKTSQRLLKEESRETAVEKLNVIKEYKKLEKEFLDTGGNPIINKQISEFVEKYKNIGGEGIGIEEFADKVRREGIFTRADYETTGDVLKLQNLLKEASGKTGDELKSFIEPLTDSLINMRQAVDNMSSKTYLLGADDDTLKKIGENFGRYMTTVYEKYETRGLSSLIFSQFKTTDEMFNRSKTLYVNGTIKTARREYVDKQIQQIEKTGRKVTPNELLKFQEDAVKNVYSTPTELNRLTKEADNVTKKYSEKIASDEVTPYDLSNSNISKPELAEIKIDDNILKRKKLEDWQQELFGIIRDPSYTFISTVGKQANLNFTTEYLNRIAQVGKSGKNPFVVDIRSQVKNEFGDVSKWRQYTNDTGMPNDLDGLYVKAPQYEGILEVTSNWLNKSNIGTFYKYAVLGPKAASQIAKTILSPLTHVRNLISAGAFVSANGAFFPNYGDIQMLLPKMLGGQGLIGQAYSLTGKRIFGTLTDTERKLYQKLLQVGVVDSQVQYGEMKRLLRDILKDPAAVEKGLYDKLPKSIIDRSKKGLLNVYTKLQDSYVAEDDFWKIINWNLERNRHSTIVSKLGINQNNIKGILDNDKDAIASIGKSFEENKKIADYFRKLAPRRDYINTAQNSKEFYDNFLDEVAGNLTRNQIPNYAYIGRTAKALRLTPFGNFIAFPLEIIRTGHNIFQRSIDEIYSGIPEIRDLGMKRLFSFGATVGGVPYGLVEMYKSKNGVTDEEMDALRKFVPSWSKNSTLLPVGKDKNGYLQYIDFSYSNAYDTLIRPFNAIQGALVQGDQNKESVAAALAEGIQQSIFEILKPYTTESIFTEALVDSTIRRGIGRGGKKVWDKEDETMVKIGKGILHIGKTLVPGSYEQIKRLGQTATGRTDKYGTLYNLEDELGSLYGFRTINSDPERALTFMTTDLGKGLDNAEGLFKSNLLKGGRISSERILNTYKYTEGIRYAKLKEMYQNIEAAKTLGVPEFKIREKVQRKGIAKSILKDLYQGVFTPKRPNDFNIKKISEINRELNKKEGIDLPNPFYEVIPEITSFINKNRRISLEGDNLNLMNFKPEPIQQPEQQIQVQPLQTTTIDPRII
jgi:hypothetical protein